MPKPGLPRKALPRPSMRSLLSIIEALFDNVAIVSGDGVVIIKAQQHRSLASNRAEALQRLADMVLAAQRVPRPRHATTPTRASVQRRLQTKARRGGLKALRSGAAAIE